MVNPHAILLSRDNIPEIVRETHATVEGLEDLLEDARHENIPYYIVFERYPISGLPKWHALPEPDFKAEYGNVECGRRFTRIHHV